jgi:hypothetical protein
MKATISGRRYNTDKCAVLCTTEHHTASGNYSGSTKLLRAPDGMYLVWRDSNGEDCHMGSFLWKWDPLAWPIDDFDMTDEQEARCAELKLITIID